MNQPFAMLRFFAWCHIVVGFVLMGLAVSAVFAVLFNLPDDRVERFLVSTYGIAAIVGLLIAGVASAAYGQFIQLVLRIEENTRQGA